MKRRRELPSQRVRDLFDAALDQPQARRDAWLARACGDDRTLRLEVEGLLEAERRAPAFLERPAAESELVGERAGAWRLEALLASGGMGDVYRAVREEADLPWRVAIKVLKRGLDGAAFVRRFKKERRMLAALAHPNVVALVDAGTLEDGRPFLAMELVDGEPIDRHCRERRLDPAARVRLLLAVCGAVDHAHRRLVVHGDLKPGNVLVARGGADADQGVVKLLDFGVARLGEDDGGAPRSQPWTPGYASPELRAGEPLGAASDVYSLGVLLRELCVEADGDVRRRGPDPDLVAIANEATQRDPALRYASAAALAEELRAWLELRPVAARRGGAAVRLRKFVARNRIACAAACVALVALAWGARESWLGYEFARLDAQSGWGAHAQALGVVDFLQELALDARGGDDAALTAALERAAARLDAASPQDGEAEGRMRAALGQLFLKVGRPDAAQRQFERALALAQRSRGFDLREVEALRRLLERSRR